MHAQEDVVVQGGIYVGGGGGGQEPVICNLWTETGSILSKSDSYYHAVLLAHRA